MGGVAILIPYAPLCEARTKALHWCVKRWSHLLPNAEIIIGQGRRTADPGGFNRPAALNAALAQTTADVLVIADCDTTTDLAVVERTRMAQHGAWSVPTTYRRLTPGETNLVLQRDHDVPALPVTAEQDVTAFSWSGVVVLPRAAILAVGGFDERFDGWSADDVALGMALETMYQPVVRSGTVWHFHHPRPANHSYSRAGYGNASRLTERYVKAHNDPGAMRALLKHAPTERPYRATGHRSRVKWTEHQ